MQSMQQLLREEQTTCFEKFKEGSNDTSQVRGGFEKPWPWNWALVGVALWGQGVRTERVKADPVTSTAGLLFVAASVDKPGLLSIRLENI